MALTVAGMLITTAAAVIMIMNLAPRDPGPAAEEAARYAEQGDYEKAREFYGRAYRRSLSGSKATPESNKYLTLIGDMCLAEGDARGAIGSWRAVTTNDPQNEAAQRKIVEFMLELARDMRAVKWSDVQVEAEKLLSINATHPTGMQALGLALIMQRTAKEDNLTKGEQYLTDAYNADKSNADFASTLASFQLQQNQPEKAVAVFDELMANLPEEAEKRAKAWRLRGRFYLIRSITDRQELARKEAARAIPTELAQARQQVTKSDAESLRSLEEALKLGPQDADNLIALGEYWISMVPGATDETLRKEYITRSQEFFTKAIDADKDGYEAYLRLAQLHMSNREPAKALQVLSQREQRGVRREGYKGSRNRYYMAMVRNEMFRVLMVQSESLTPPPPGQTSTPERDMIVQQMQRLRDQQEADSGKDDPGVLFMNGRLWILKGDINKAVRALEDARRQVPDNPELQQYLAQLYMRMREYGPASEALKTVLQAYPNNDKAWAIQAMLLREMGQADPALQAAERALQINPNNKEALVTMGRIYETKQNWAKVKEVSDRLAQAGGDTLTGKLQEAGILLAQAQGSEEPNPDLTAKAESLLKEVLTESPGNLTALRQLILLARDPKKPDSFDPKLASEIQAILKEQEAVIRKKLAEASASTQPARSEVDQYQRSLDGIEWFLTLIDPKTSKEEQSKHVEDIIRKNEDPFIVAAQLYQWYAAQPGREKEALEQLQKAYELKPDNPGIIEALFVRALQDKDWAAAEKYAKRATELNIDRTGGHMYRGRMLAVRPDVENGLQRAIEEFRAGLKEFPTYSQGYVLLGRALAQAKQNDEAFQAFAEAFRLNPANGVAALGLATISTLRGDAIEAEKYLKDCERLIPNHPWVRQQLQSSEDKRDPKRGIGRREEIRRTDPKNTDNLLRLAALYQSDGQPDKARAIYEECRKIDPKNFAVVQAYADFLRVKDPPEVELASKIIQELVDAYGSKQDSKDPKQDGLNQATAQLLMAAHLSSVSAIPGLAKPPTTQAVDEAYLAAAAMSDHPAVRLDIGEHFKSNQRWAEAEKWYREAIERAQAEKAPETEKAARQNLIGVIVRSRDPAREEDLKKEIDEFRAKYNDPYGFLAESEFLANAGRLDQALAAINQYVERRPDSANGHFLRGNIFFLRSMWQDAMNDYRTAKSQDPRGFNLQHRVRLALCLEHLGQIDLAITELASVLSDNPDHMGALDEILRIHTKLGQWSQAEKELLKRARAEPDNPEWPARLVSLYRSSKEGDKAVQTATQLALKTQFAPAAVETLLQVFLQFERYDDLLKFVDTRLPEAMRKGIYIDLMTAAAFAGKGDRISALQRYGRVLDEMSPNIERFSSAAEDMKMRLGAQAAMEAIQQRLNAKPDERASKFMLGRLKKDAGDRDAYLGAIRTILDSLPESTAPEIVADRYFLLQSQAIENYQRKEYEEARKGYEEMLKIDPNSIVALNNLAYLLMEHFKTPEQALPYSRQAAYLLPFDANVLDTVGWNHVLLGNYDIGIAALRRAIGIDDSLPAIHYHAAEAFARRAEAVPAGRDADLREAETECKRAHELIQAAGRDTESIFDRVLALSEKLGLRLDPKLSKK